jgi:hypothetical protein
MSQEAVQDVLKKLGSDAEFRKRMRTDSAAALDKDFAGKLDAAEKKILTGMTGAFAADLKQAERPWYLPSSFKEVGGAILSLGLLVLFFWVLGQTYAQIAVPPQAVKIEGATQILDVFGRAKDLLNILFPLFAAVVTFWLGVAVEGKRADDNKATADKAGKDAANAQANEQKVRVSAASALGNVKGQVMALRSAKRSDLPPVDPGVLDSLMLSLEDGEKAVHH